MYPTKEQILSAPYKIKELDKGSINAWKKMCYIDKWKKADTKGRIIYLGILLGILNNGRKANPLKGVTLGHVYAYSPKSKVIMLDKRNPSILSTLHEYGHHLLGPSELEACVWSIRLFEKTFPNEFKKLRWEGHMLKLAK